MNIVLNYPTKEHLISQPFGFDNTNHTLRANFYVLFESKHPGVDFDVLIGTSVHSSFAGIVVRNEYHTGMGNVVGIRNGNIVSLYAHLSHSRVKLGQIINHNYIIGLSGDTGEACTKPHLHFELRDLTKSTLNKMVFEPIFDKPIKQYSESFFYKVNNINTSKNLAILSKLYFGTINHWKLIARNNKGLSKCTKNDELENGSKIKIPNFTAIE